MARLIHYRAMEFVAKGAPSTYEVAIDKMYNCELAQRAAEFAMEVLGPAAGCARVQNMLLLTDGLLSIISILVLYHDGRDFRNRPQCDCYPGPGVAQCLIQVF
jgi:alkylation response protein AidB-like acyl-CoA dehydrogenase